MLKISLTVFNLLLQIGNFLSSFSFSSLQGTLIHFLGGNDDLRGFIPTCGLGEEKVAAVKVVVVEVYLKGALELSSSADEFTPTVDESTFNG